MNPAIRPKAKPALFVSGKDVFFLIKVVYWEKEMWRKNELTQNQIPEP